MIRRRRGIREIPFSFDSFLDVVANVVGIVIRLILVAWVGARSYSSLKVLPKRLAHPAPPAQTSVSQDPLSSELAEHRRRLAEARARLLDQLRQLKLVRQQQGPVKDHLGELLRRQETLEQEKTAVDNTALSGRRASQTAALSLEELRERQRRLLEDTRAVEKLPPVPHVLRYYNPVSRPVQAEEFFFECRSGRVAFIDIASLLSEVRGKLEEKGKELRDRWQASDVTVPVGAFRLRYTVERQRSLAEAVFPGLAPEAGSSFGYGLSEWIVEPVAPLRGAAVAEALTPGSEFRQVVDRLDPQQAVVTFWIYPDSFAVFRRLRDYLYERGLVVAGRPLPEGIPITCSRRGALSRAQ